MCLPILCMGVVTGFVPWPAVTIYLDHIPTQIYFGLCTDMSTGLNGR